MLNEIEHRKKLLRGTPHTTVKKHIAKKMHKMPPKKEITMEEAESRSDFARGN